MIAFQVPFRIAIVLDIQSAFDAFLANFVLGHLLSGTPRTLVFIHTGWAIRGVLPTIDDALGSSDGGQHLAAFLDFVLLVADGLVEFLRRQRSFRLLGSSVFGAIHGDDRLQMPVLQVGPEGNPNSQADTCRDGEAAVVAWSWKFRRADWPGIDGRFDLFEKCFVGAFGLLAEQFIEQAIFGRI